MDLCTLKSRLPDGKEIWEYTAGYLVCVSESDKNGRPTSYEVKTSDEKVYVFAEEKRDILEVFQSIKEGKADQNHLLLGVHDFSVYGTF